PVARQGYDFSNTRRSTKPKFFVQGESDEICPIQDMWKFYGSLPEPKELVVIDGADHLFNGHTTDVGDALEDLLVDFDERTSNASEPRERSGDSGAPASERVRGPGAK